MSALRRMIRAIHRADPVASFPVFCDRRKRGKFYQVVILRQRRRLPGLALALTSGERGWQNALGFCHALDVLEKTRRGWRSSRLAGFVVLVASSIGVGYVSHEMTHAAHFRLLRQGGRKRRPFERMPLGDDRIAEPLASMQGWLVTQFWSEYYRLFPHVVPGTKAGA